MASRSKSAAEFSQRDEVRKILASSCSSCQAARLLVDERLVEAEFASVSDHGVRLRLIQPSTVTLTPLTICFVTFLLGSRSCAFAGKIQSFDVASLVLDIPAGISIAEGRLSYRVPVLKSCRLGVRIHKRDDLSDGVGAAWSVEGVDISLTGILVEFSSGIPAEIDVGKKVMVELKLDSETLFVAGVIRRLSQPKCAGVFFPETVRQGEVFAPTSLRNMVGQLERKWIQEKPD